MSIFLYISSHNFFKKWDKKWKVVPKRPSHWDASIALCFGIWPLVFRKLWLYFFKKILHNIVNSLPFAGLFYIWKTKQTILQKWLTPSLGRFGDSSFHRWHCLMIMMLTKHLKSLKIGNLKSAWDPNSSCALLRWIGWEVRSWPEVSQTCHVPPTGVNPKLLPSFWPQKIIQPNFEWP